MAEGGGLLNRYTLEKVYRGFESLRLRQRFECKNKTDGFVIREAPFSRGFFYGVLPRMGKFRTKEKVRQVYMRVDLRYSTG